MVELVLGGNTYLGYRPITVPSAPRYKQGGRSRIHGMSIGATVATSRFFVGPMNVASRTVSVLEPLLLMPLLKSMCSLFEIKLIPQ